MAALLPVGVSWWLVIALSWGVCCAQAAPLLTLEEARSRALATHEALIAARAGRERAGVASWRAWAAMGPTVHGTGSYTRVREPISLPSFGGLLPESFNTTVVAQDVVRGILSVTQPLYTHEFWALRRLGQAEIAASDSIYRAARQDVLLAVTAAYYDLLRTQALAGVAAEAGRLAQTEVAHAHARVAAGEAVRSDELRAQTQLAQAEQQIVATAGGVTAAADRLRRLTATQEAFEVAEPPPAALDLAAPEPFVTSAHSGNPDLAIQEAQLAAARAEEQRRLAALLPSVGTRWNYARLNHTTFSELDGYWTLVFAVQVPLFEGGGTRHLDLAEQRALVKQTEAQVAGFRRDLEVEVRNAYVTARTLDAQLSAAERQVEFARESYRILSAQYEAGVATNLDVLSALTVRTQAEANQAGVRYARAVAAVQLKRVAGLLGDTGESTP